MLTAMTQTRRGLSSHLFFILVVAQFQVDFNLVAAQLYNAINGYLCMRSNFVITIPGAMTDISCASHCSYMVNCQAFTVNDGPCQLFVFDKCSKNVRDCSCTRRGQVFVKEQAGLPPGALCPTGYGDDLCGVKYRLITHSGNWQQQLARCQTENSNLVIFSDVIDATEMTHVDSLYTKYGNQFWLGGFQRPGSVEPLGGWHWVACNSSIDLSLWAPGEPGNSVENAVFRSYANAKLSDLADGTWHGGLCECLSPFD